ncbi:MAG: aminoacyl-tRNA hydrolase [Ignavibacteriales bacterium]|nr:aminoacyl-tRNA hydrolase [Ignavibacteriales bacterium]
MNDQLTVNGKVAIPMAEIQFLTSRSGGPGGQNVNKLETRVELIFEVDRSRALTSDQKARVHEHLQSRIDSDGRLHVVAQESRSQWQNKQSALDKLVTLLQKALKPKKKRIKTRATRESKEKRMQGKKRTGEKKKLRRVNVHEY